jgi:predicted SnoaL-like aldol condensation-catalyzing enzyme
MAKKTKRGSIGVARAKTGVKAAKAKATGRPSTAVRAKRTTRAKGGMKAKAVRLLEKISAKVSAARDDVKVRAQDGSKALAEAGAKATASARRTFQQATSKASATQNEVAAQLAQNKQLVLDFYRKLIGEKDYEGARQYMGEEYRQHAPYVKKVIAEGDLVVLHLHGKSGPNPFGESVVDIFRIKDGKVVEHWDVIQPIPESADNANSMF